MESSATVVGDRVFVGSRDGTAYCLDADGGDIEWQSEPLGAYVVSSPAYYGDRIYIGSSELPTNSDS